MHNALLIARHEFLVTVSRPSYRLFAALVPVLAVLGLFAMVMYQNFSEDEPDRALDAGIVDLTGGPEGDPLFNAFFQQDNVRFILQPDVATATRLLLDGTLDRLYVIPENYLAEGVIIEVKPEEAGLGDFSDGGGNPNVTPLGKFLLNNLFVGSVGAEEAQRVLVPFTLITTEVDETGAVVIDPSSAGRLLFFLGLGVMMMVSVFTTSGYLLQGLTEEKENRIMEILLSSVKPEHLMLGKLFGLGAAGLLQMALWAASGVIFLALLGRITGGGLDIDLTPSFLGLLAGGAYFLLGYFFFATLMAALGAITSTQREAKQVTFLVVMPGVVPAWFMEQVIGNPEGTLARVLSMVPFSAPLASLTRLGAGGMGPIDLAVSLTLLAASVAGAMWVTARLFRAYLLSYGQRPGLRQIINVLRDF